MSPNYDYSLEEEAKLEKDRDDRVEMLRFVKTRISELLSARNEAEARLQKLTAQLPKTAVEDIPAVVLQMQGDKAVIPVLTDLIEGEMNSRTRLEAEVKQAREIYAKYADERRADEANRRTRQKLGWS